MICSWSHTKEMSEVDLNPGLFWFQVTRFITLSFPNNPINPKRMFPCHKSTIKQNQLIIATVSKMYASFCPLCPLVLPQDKKHVSPSLMNSYTDQSSKVFQVLFKFTLLWHYINCFPGSAYFALHQFIQLFPTFSEFFDHNFFKKIVIK